MGVAALEVSEAPTALGNAAGQQKIKSQSQAQKNDRKQVAQQLTSSRSLHHLNFVIFFNKFVLCWFLDAACARTPTFSRRLLFKIACSQ